MYHPIVMDEADTIRALLDTGKRYRGMARWGDGDFGGMRGWKDVYQICESSRSEALAHRLACPAPGVLNCLPRPVTAQESGNDPHSLPSIRWQSYWQGNRGVLTTSLRLLKTAGGCIRASLSRSRRPTRKS